MLACACCFVLFSLAALPRQEKMRKIDKKMVEEFRENIKSLKTLTLFEQNQLNCRHVLESFEALVWSDLLNVVGKKDRKSLWVDILDLNYQNITSLLVAEYKDISKFQWNKVANILHKAVESPNFEHPRYNELGVDYYDLRKAIEKHSNLRKVSIEAFLHFLQMLFRVSHVEFAVD